MSRSGATYNRENIYTLRDDTSRNGALKASQIKLVGTHAGGGGGKERRKRVVALSFLTTPCRAASAGHAVVRGQEKKPRGGRAEEEKEEEEGKEGKGKEGAVVLIPREEQFLSFRGVPRSTRSRSLIAWPVPG